MMMRLKRVAIFGALLMIAIGCVKLPGDEDDSSANDDETGDPADSDQNDAQEFVEKINSGLQKNGYSEQEANTATADAEAYAKTGKLSLQDGTDDPKQYISVIVELVAGDLPKDDGQKLANGLNAALAIAFDEAEAEIPAEERPDVQGDLMQGAVKGSLEGAEEEDADKLLKFIAEKSVEHLLPEDASADQAKETMGGVFENVMLGLVAEDPDEDLKLEEISAVIYSGLLEGTGDKATEFADEALAAMTEGIETLDSGEGIAGFDGLELDDYKPEEALAMVTAITQDALPDEAFDTWTDFMVDELAKDEDVDMAEYLAYTEAAIGDASELTEFNDAFEDGLAGHNDYNFEDLKNEAENVDTGDFDFEPPADDGFEVVCPADFPDCDNPDAQHHDDPATDSTTAGNHSDQHMCEQEGKVWENGVCQDPGAMDGATGGTTDGANGGTTDGATDAHDCAMYDQNSQEYEMCMSTAG